MTKHKTKKIESGQYEYRGCILYLQGFEARYWNAVKYQDGQSTVIGGSETLGGLKIIVDQFKDQKQQERKMK